MERISREEYYFKVVEAVALRATCNRGRSGAILVKDQRIIATGYVGSPSGAPQCDEVGHEMVDVFDGTEIVSAHCVRTLHAEENALLQCARYGPPCDGAVIYCTMIPCYWCAKALINAGIREVHALFDYQKSDRSIALFDQMGIKWTVKSKITINYEA
jgi:dCMP deaminase